jgi:hypothetical protein
MEAHLYQFHHQHHLMALDQTKLEFYQARFLSFN